MTIWIHGPSAWDSVIEIEHLPKSGDFIRALSKEERPGGSGLNVAMALVSADVEVGFITYLGDDQFGESIKDLLIQANFKYLKIKKSALPTLHALLIKDQTGDRTIIALEPTEMAQLGLEGAEIKQGDIFIFTLWRSEYISILNKLNSNGVICIVGTKALEDRQVSAHYAVGSVKDFGKADLELARNNFVNIILTDAENGAISYSKNEEIHQESLASEIKDATGAGDSFLAGYALALAKGLDSKQRLYMASAWAASTLTYNSSLPPKWSEIKDRWGFK